MKRKSEFNDLINYLNDRKVGCKSPGDLTDLLYQKWLDIGTVEELEEFYIKPETMLRLLNYERHNQLLSKEQTKQDSEWVELRNYYENH